jgi:large subunit ribosomal protein L25
MKRIALTAHPRSAVGKGPNRRLRSQGSIPAVLYGQKSDPVMLTVDAHEFTVSTSKIGDDLVMFELSVPESDLQGQLAMVREVQRDPVTERIIHMDILRIDAQKPIEVDVPVHGTGTPIGVQLGGQLEHVSRTVRVRCLIDDIPDHVTVDLTNVGMGQAFHIRDLNLGDKIEIISLPSDVLYLVAAPRKEEETAAATGEASTAAPEAAKGGAAAKGAAAPAATTGKAAAPAAKGKK